MILSSSASPLAPPSSSEGFESFEDSSAKPGVSPKISGYAGFWKRFVAALIDVVLIGVVFILVSILLLIMGLGIDFSLGGGIEPRVFIILNLISIVIPWIYWAAMESSSRQATLGKMALGIIVTDLDGNRISFARATGRYLAKIVSGIILYIGFIMAAFTGKKQALHDIMAGCLVVDKR